MSQSPTTSEHATCRATGYRHRQPTTAGWVLSLAALLIAPSGCKVEPHGTPNVARPAEAEVSKEPLGWAKEPDCGTATENAVVAVLGNWPSIPPQSQRSAWAQPRCWLLVTAGGSKRSATTRVGQGRNFELALEHAAKQLRATHSRMPMVLRVDIPFDLQPLSKMSKENGLSAELRGLTTESPGAALLYDELHRHRLIGRRDRLEAIKAESSTAIELLARTARAEPLAPVASTDGAAVQPNPKQRYTASFRTRGFAAFNAPSQPSSLQLEDGLVTNVALETFRILAAANSAGGYLINAVLDDGRFRYQVFAPSGTTAPAYNLPRHAGAVYAMYDLARMLEVPGSSATKIDPHDLLQAADEAAELLVEKLVPCPDLPDALCVQENREISIGGNGLAVLALLQHPHPEARRNRLHVAKKLGQWLMHRMDGDGFFPLQAIAYPSGKALDNVSEFYPGEAAYALGRLATVLAETEDRDAARFRNLARKAVRARQDSYIGLEGEALAHDHWLALSMSALPTALLDGEDQDYSQRLARAILLDQTAADTPGHAWHLRGGYSSRASSTAAATRGEALGALLASTLEEDASAATVAAVRAALCNTVAFTLRSQLGPERALFFPNQQRLIGGVTRSVSAPTLRVDFTQHALSATLGLIRHLDRTGRTCPN